VDNLLENDAGKTFTQQYMVRAYETDPLGRLSVMSVCNMLQDTAGGHARALGLGIHDLGDYTWVLSRLSVRMNFYPGWGERVIIETWPSGANRLFALRDFLLTSEDGAIIGRAVSAWVIIDLDTRRPVNNAPFIEHIPRPFREGVGLDTPSKLAPPADISRTCTYTVRHSELDINRHVNNVSYIGWCIDSTSEQILETKRCTGLDIAFLSEAQFGDIVIARTGPEESGDFTFCHEIIREGDDKPVVRGKSIWVHLE